MDKNYIFLLWLTVSLGDQAFPYGMGIGKGVLNSKDQLESAMSNSSPSLKSFIPGSKALSFQIWTLNNGLIVYPGPKLPADALIGFHSFTNQSGFLEVMWTNVDSLHDFIKSSPSSVYYVFMTFDSNAAEIVSWM